ncbi:MAG: hypothetical protein AAGM36_00315 [Cyanobacteria bacterium J06597_1]
MACQITFQDRWVQLNNKQFRSLMSFALDVAESHTGSDEQVHIDRMKRLSQECWPGRGIEIERDFPDLPERKFWSRIFLDTSRAIFERSIGIHEHTFWQARTIYLAYSTGLLFESAVQQSEPGWHAETADRQEFQRVYETQ